MNVVAIYDLPEDRNPLGAPLAQALGKTLYEANARLRAPGPGPLIIGSFDRPEMAGELKAKLQSAGFKAITVSDDEVKPVRSRLSAKVISFDEKAIQVATRQRNMLEVPFSGVRLLIHVMGSQSTTSSETIKESKFDVRMAVMTSGLKMTKTTEKTVEHTAETCEPFIVLLAPGKPVLEFREAGLDYDFLGAASQPSRAANFNAFVTMLWDRCQNAVYDNRLLQKPEQIKLLGSQLNPEKYLDTALTVLAKVLWAVGNKQ